MVSVVWLDLPCRWITGNIHKMHVEFAHASYFLIIYSICSHRVYSDFWDPSGQTYVDQSEFVKCAFFYSLNHKPLFAITISKLILPATINYKSFACAIPIWAATCDFQQCGILTNVDSEPVQPPFKLRHSQWCSVSSLTVRIFKRLAKALISLRVCAGWSEPLPVAHTALLEISCRGSYQLPMVWLIVRLTISGFWVKTVFLLQIYIPTIEI